jgi:hypothetical protein
MTRPMPRLLCSLLGSLLLSACHRSEDPAPALQGQWQVQSQTHYRYNLDGSLAQRSGPVSLSGIYRVDLTADTLFLVYIGGPQPPSRKTSQYYPYTRQGNRFVVPPPSPAQSIEAVDLTAHALTLLFHEYPSTVGTSYNELKLTR